MTRDPRPDLDLAIRDLVADLTPVRRVRPPVLNAVIWLGVVATIAAVLSRNVDATALAQRLRLAPDLWLAVLGSTATMILSVIATFELGLPDRSPAWAFAPLPALALWLGASGIGCLRMLDPAGPGPIPLHEIKDCFMFIVGLSVPLSVALMVLQRRTYSLRPRLETTLTGLSAAAAAATLLTFVHPFDATALDLGVHFTAVATAIGLGHVGRALLDRKAGAST